MHESPNRSSSCRRRRFKAGQLFLILVYLDFSNQSAKRNCKLSSQTVKSGAVVFFGMHICQYSKFPYFFFIILRMCFECSGNKKSLQVKGMEKDERVFDSLSINYVIVILVSYFLIRQLTKQKKGRNEMIFFAFKELFLRRCRYTSRLMSFSAHDRNIYSRSCANINKIAVRKLFSDD